MTQQAKEYWHEILWELDKEKVWIALNLFNLGVGIIILAQRSDKFGALLIGLSAFVLGMILTRCLTEPILHGYRKMSEELLEDLSKLERDARKVIE